MGQPLFSNNAYTTLSIGCTSGDTTLTVASSSTFPAVLTASGNWFYACLQDTFANLEIVKVTNVTGTVWTVTRAIGGTSARAFQSGSIVELRMTADYLNDVYAYSITGNLQNSTPQWLTSVTGTNTISANLTPALTGYTAGQTFRLVTAGANTGAATININSLGAKALTKQGGTALVSGDVAASSAYEITYDGAQFQLIGGAPAANATNATNLTGATPWSVPYQSAASVTSYVAPGTAGQVLTSAGTAAPAWTTPAVASGGFSNLAVFTASGTWTIPAGITKCKVTVVGGGGSGLSGSCGSGGGGGGGGTAIKVISGLTPGGTTAVTVGGTSGTSSFGAYCSATGGANGSNVGVYGGVGSSGDLNLGGGAGTAPIGGSTYGGDGGSSALGGGGGGGAFGGTNGRNYGGGGGGGSTNYGPGGGAGGVVIVEY